MGKMNVLLGIISALAANHAGAVTKTITIVDEVHNVSIPIDATNVRCSAVGYSTPELKILVPDLKWISFLDHTNPGEAFPCMTSQRCRNGVGPELILDKGLGYEDTKLRRVLTHVFEIDETAKTCYQRIEENVSLNLRGLDFTHFRHGDLGAFPFELCEKL